MAPNDKSKEYNMFVEEKKDQSNDEKINKDELDAETKLWSELPVDAWKQSVLNEDSIFHDLYLDTRRRLVEAYKEHNYDVIIEVGCGTGEVIAHVADAGVPRIGVDINETFVKHCRSAYKDQADLTFHVGDASKLDDWWEESGLAQTYEAPLLVCPNNTIMIMPAQIREEVLEKMRVVAGEAGRCLVTYWNGTMFAHGVMGYYKKNSDLCGDFDLTSDHINWEDATIETKTSYKSEWLKADDIVRWASSLMLEVELVEAQMEETPEIDHVAEVGIGIYLWVKGKPVEPSATSSARDYYDSKDAQTFYSTVWGPSTTHIGRYDLIEADPKLAALPLREKIRHAQLLDEKSLKDNIIDAFGEVKVRCLDMGCGYGGLLRSMASDDMLWSGIGVDISGKMVDSARTLTSQEAKLSQDVKSRLVFHRESYMHTCAPDEGMDVCVSLDAFLHVGPGQHDNVLQEAWRVLRPGGRLIFTDIVARPDAPPEAKELYERIGLQSFATVPGYFEKARKYGFGELSFEDHSENVSKHYGYVHEVLQQLWADGEIDISPEFKERMSEGLLKWRDLAPSCLQWGILSMRKLDYASSDEESSQ